MPIKFIFAVCAIACAACSVFAQPKAADSLVLDVSNASQNQDNPSVSINRKNNNVIVIAASSDFTDMDLNGISAYTSTDSGKTWNLFRLPLPPDQLFNNGQPSVTCDNAGNFYYAYVTNDDVDSAGSIVVAKSADGKVWNNATPIDNNSGPPLYGAPEQPALCVDNSPSSPHNGRVYVVWYQNYNVDSLSLRIGAYIAWSDNKCATWSKPLFLALSDGYQMVRTGKNGEIFVTVTDSTGLGDQLFVSGDGGSTFTSPISRLANNYPFFTSGDYTGSTGLKGSQGVVAFPYPAIDVDINTNRIHAIFSDYQADVATESYSYSDDNGITWTVPQIVGVNSLDSADRFDPWVSVDQKTGDAYLTYFSSESDPKNIQVAPYRLYLSPILPDQPQMLSPNFDPLIVERTASTAPFIGDHTASDAYGGIYVGSWTQNRSGLTDGDVYAFISIAGEKNSVPTRVVIRSEQSWLSVPFPNPVYANSVSVSYYLPQSTHLAFGIVDESGRVVRNPEVKMANQGSFSEEFSLGGLPPGAYFIRMITDMGVLSQKFVVNAR